MQCTACTFVALSLVASALKVLLQPLEPVKNSVTYGEGTRDLGAVDPLGFPIAEKRQVFTFEFGGSIRLGRILG